MPTIIQNIERAISERGLKKKYVADKAGYSPQQFSDLLSGRRVLKAIDISKIARALDVSPNELFREIQSDQERR